MGQRLVITIKNDEEELAKAYYHWSGYTAPALSTANMAVRHFGEIFADSMFDVTLCKILSHSKRGELLTACRMLFATGAGLDIADGEPEKFEALFPKTNYSVGNSRNDGLIAFTEETMNKFQAASEGDIYIDIANRTVDVSNFFWEAEMEAGFNHNLREPFCDLGYDLCNVSFEDMEDLTETVCNAINGGEYLFVENGELLTAVV